MKNNTFLIVNILLVFSSFLHYSCLNEELGELNYINNLTVQASIDEGNFAEVYLTNAIPFSGVIDSLQIVKAVESKAKVTIIAADGKQDVLTLKRDNTRYPFLFYQGSIIKGEVGAEYVIDIELGGETITSTTNIPDAPIFEKIEFIDYYEDNLLQEDVKDLKLTLTKNSTETEYFKFKIKQNGVDDNFISTDPYIINTENINTASFSFILKYKSLNNDVNKIENRLVLGQEFFLEIISITQEEYEFLKAIGGDETTLLDGFSFNEQVPSNLSSGAFGYWSGENVSTIFFTVE